MTLLLEISHGKDEEKGGGKGGVGEPQFTQITYKNSIRASKRAGWFFIAKTKEFMLYRRIIN